MLEHGIEASPELGIAAVLGLLLADLREVLLHGEVLVDEGLTRGICVDHAGGTVETREGCAKGIGVVGGSINPLTGQRLGLCAVALNHDESMIHTYMTSLCDRLDHI